MPLNVNTLIANIIRTLHGTSLSDLIFWSDATLTRFLREALMRHSQQIGGFVARDITSVSLVNGTATYSLPANHLDTIHVALGGTTLLPSSTSELELRDDAYQTTAATTNSPVTYWYEDKAGANVIGLYPVPASGAGAGSDLEVIFHQDQCGIDEAHTNTSITAPAILGDYLELKVIERAYSEEGDGQQVEVGQAAGQIAGLMEQALQGYFDVAQ